MLVLFACSEQKSTTAAASSTAITEAQPTAEEMTAQGFVAGVIKASNGESTCDYTIETRSLTYLLDPTNLDKDFKEDELTVWFKFRQLRMQNRCPEASPVEVSEMQLLKK